MGHNKDNEPVSLEALLRIKRNEKPGDEFWESFERDFHRRRLNSLVERESIRHTLWNPTVKALMVGVPAFALVVMGLFWVRAEEPAAAQNAVAGQAQPIEVNSVKVPRRLPEQDQNELAALSVGNLSSQFVVDAIPSDNERKLNFRKVLYTPAIHISAPSGASYVRDSLSSREYNVTTADFKLGRNF